MRWDFKEMIKAEEIIIGEITLETETELKFYSGSNIMTAILDYDVENGGTIKIYDVDMNLYKEINIAGMFI